MKLQAPEHVLSINIGGKALEVVAGLVDVSDAQALVLLSHGFTQVKEPTKEGKAKKRE